MPPVKWGGRVCGKYTRNERSIMDPFKDEYKNANSPSERQHIAMNLIFKALFVYWTQNNGVISSKDAQLQGQNLADWLQNNWRRPKQKSKLLMPFIVKRADIAYCMKKEEVGIEISSILGVKNAMPSTPRWFETRTMALHNIMKGMTPAEQQELDKNVAQIEKEGYPADQKKSNAAKHCTCRFYDSARHHWFEMGVLSVSVVAYLNPSNQLAVEVHDRSLEVMGMKLMDTFQDRHREKLHEIQHLWLDYVRKLLDRQEGKLPRGMGDPIGMGNGRQDTGKVLALSFSDDGYPRLPADLNIDKLTKKEACALVQSYLTQNYLLATYCQSNQVPYKAISESTLAQSHFIHPKYLPTGLSLADPQNMKLSNIRDFFHHIQQRERTEIPAQVFCFRQVHSTRRKGELMPTHYPDEIDPENPPFATKKKVGRRKKKAEDTASNDVHPETSSLAAASISPATPLASQVDGTVAMMAEIGNVISTGGRANDFHPNASNNCKGGKNHIDVSPVVLPAQVPATHLGFQDQQNALLSNNNTHDHIDMSPVVPPARVHLGFQDHQNVLLSDNNTHIDMYQKALDHMYTFDMCDTSVFSNGDEMNNYGTLLDWNRNQEGSHNYQDENFFNPGFASLWPNTGEIQAMAVANSNFYNTPNIGSTHPVHHAANAVINPGYITSPWVQGQSVPSMIGGVGFHGGFDITDPYGGGRGMLQQLSSMGTFPTDFQPVVCLMEMANNDTNMQKVSIPTADNDTNAQRMSTTTRPQPVRKFKKKQLTTAVGEPVPPTNFETPQGKDRQGDVPAEGGTKETPTC